MSDPNTWTKEEQERWLREECGKLAFFDLNPYLHVADILTAGDEPMLALKVLDMVPGFYRDHYPKEMHDKKREIIAKLATPGFYVTNPYDSMVRADNAHLVVEGTLRGQLILKDVQDYNAKGLEPHIVDLGPGEYWLSIGLKKKGCKFTYQPIGLCTDAHEKAKDHILLELSQTPSKDAPRIFVACEIIEHLHHEADIRTDCERVGCVPDIIHISTPKYSFDGRAEKFKWQNQGDLGHLRTYTPMEFQNVVLRMWPEYRWGFIDSQPMHMRGSKPTV